MISTAASILLDRATKFADRDKDGIFPSRANILAERDQPSRQISELIFEASDLVYMSIPTG